MAFPITIEKISVLTAIIGIALLFFLQEISLPAELKISEINKQKIGQTIKTSGRVTLLSETENTIIFELSDGNKISAVKFNPSIQERALIREKKFLQITGKIQQYRKELEIVADKVEEWTQ